MARAPYNVLVLPYKMEKSTVQYCIFKREDMSVWQFIAGGGEDDELPLIAAQRETLEEAGIRSDELLSLTSMCHVAANLFSEKSQKNWGDKVIVIPVYSFAVLCDVNMKISISDEHLEYQWSYYDEAIKLLHFDLDKTALYELNERINRNNVGRNQKQD
ncbi:NUDIX hydrolase [Entomospira culicis]|uniref:NUDIX domain-containing protein n=1 Tax=Entomospira culicis TaxID=2719989 RepID=A0A968GIG8_9SPIO|nr:NUDIX domain-containing protein [Entomospira culicis]NIZ19433.1 NUDIX domain-containing protein [Entomospira culicis]NIZ69662.1 NUDIX domain-containing protein [Entomospira culicis]WDI36772.1 NUDIX domain-containing protein [Entomospira culicis]WDI38401.1 NUDIX domain-containing protein [Entomospira culicis]